MSKIEISIEELNEIYARLEAIESAVGISNIIKKKIQEKKTIKSKKPKTNKKEKVALKTNNKNEKVALKTNNKKEKVALKTKKKTQGKIKIKKQKESINSI